MISRQDAKTPRSILAILYLLSSILAADAAHLLVPVIDPLSRPYTNCNVTLLIGGSPQISSTSLVATVTVTNTTDSNGICWFSNTVAGTYTLTIQTLPRYTTFTITVPTNEVATNVFGMVGATLQSGDLAGYTKTEAAGLFVLKTNGWARGPTFGDAVFTNAPSLVNGLNVGGTAVITNAPSLVAGLNAGGTATFTNPPVFAGGLSNLAIAGPVTLSNVPTFVSGLSNLAIAGPVTVSNVPTFVSGLSNLAIAGPVSVSNVPTFVSGLSNLAIAGPVSVSNVPTFVKGLSNVVADGTTTLSNLLTFVSTNGPQLTLAPGGFTSNAPGLPGQIMVNSTNIYVCIATNSWVRSALSTW